MDAHPCASTKFFEFIRDFYSVRATVGQEDERRRLLVQPRRAKRARKTLSAQGATSSRHVPWTAEDASHYELVREGIPLATPGNADRLFAAKEIDETQFYLWKHRDPNLERNPNIPKWEATYYFEDRGQHARVKKCHLKNAYQRAGRVVHDEMWSVDKLPYWVDRYAFSKLKQQSSKRKYEDNKKGSLDKDSTQTE